MISAAFPSDHRECLFKMFSREAPLVAGCSRAFHPQTTNGRRTDGGVRGSSFSELHHLIPLWAFSRLGSWCVCDHGNRWYIHTPLEDHPLATHREPSALYCWILEILYCNPKGRRASLRVSSTVGRSVCLCWAKSNLKDLKDLHGHQVDLTERSRVQSSTSGESICVGNCPKIAGRKSETN